VSWSTSQEIAVRRARTYTLRTTPTGTQSAIAAVAGGGGNGGVRVHDGSAAAEPYRVGKRLTPPLDDRFSARRGTYRIIYRVEERSRVVTVVDVGHRSDVYRT
jgi:mRNA interferase RelE/StbE